MPPSGEMPPFDPGVTSAPPMATNLLSSAAPVTSQEPMIFAGWTRGQGQSTINGADQVREHQGARVPTYLTISQFMSRFDNAEREDFLRLRNMMIAAGIVSPDADPYTVRNAFASVLGDVAEMSASGTKMSPMGYVKNLIRMNGGDPSKVGSEADGSLAASEPFTGNKTQVSRSVTEITEGEAWSSLQQTLSAMLGRDPSDEEVRQFTYKMNGLAAANPSISKTITKFKDGEAVSSNTHTSGGLSAGDVAEEAYNNAQSKPGYGEYQAATTYFNAALSALGAIGQT